MSWADRVKASPAVATATEARAVIEAGGASSFAEQEHLDRQLRIAELVEWTLANTDPLLIPDAALANIGDHLRQGIDYLNSWRAGSGAEFLTTHAMSQFELVLLDLGSIPTGETVAEATAEVASLRRSVGQHRGQVDREIESVTAAGAEAKAAFERLARAAGERVEELEAEVQRLREELTQLTATTRDAANQQQNAFAAAQTERQEAFASLLEEKRGDTTGVVDTLKAEVASAVTAAREAGEADLDAVKDAKERVEEILGIVGEEALVGTYSKNATEERDTANIWRWIAISAIAVTVGIGIWLIVTAHAAGTDWDLFGAKLALATPIGAVAAYAARQSSEHRYAQREAEHVALQLAALKPYLSDLDKVDDRDKLLVEIASRLFGHPRRDGKREAGLGEFATDNPTLLAQLVALARAVNPPKT